MTEIVDADRTDQVASRKRMAVDGVDEGAGRTVANEDALLQFATVLHDAVPVGLCAAGVQYFAFSDKTWIPVFHPRHGADGLPEFVRRDIDRAFGFGMVGHRCSILSFVPLGICQPPRCRNATLAHRLVQQ